MPPRSKVSLLPPQVQDELNRRLIAGSFSNYNGLESWLEEQGFAIGKSSLQRYGTRFEERCKALKLATDQAKAIVAEAGDDEGAMNDALIRLVQEKSFNLLMDLDVDPEQIEFPKLVRAIADVGRTGIKQKEWAAKARQKALADAASAAQQAARRKGISEETAEFIRKQILGIGDDQSAATAV
jgi:hypothetical protein